MALRPPVDDRHGLLVWAMREGLADEELMAYRDYARGGPLPGREMPRDRARRRRIKPEDRAAVLRPGAVCAYCETREADTVDHVVPVARGGTSERSNLVPACWPCNRLKSALPVDAEFRANMKQMARLWNDLLEATPVDSPLGRHLIQLMQAARRGGP